ncbi:hypothetical protein GCM10028819_38050 [Spirosoma humi]
MDVSSKYFTQFSQRNPYRIKFLWAFLLDIKRVGKVRELISFLLWELTHKLCFYQAGNKYVQFTNDACLRISNAGAWLAEEAVTNSFLAAQGLNFQLVAVDWKYCVERADGLLWGCCYENLTKLYRSDDQSKSAVCVYTFENPITSIFLSEYNGLFVCSNGVVYKSTNNGKSFARALQLSTPISYFLFNNGMTELPDQTLIIGEYGSLWHGKSWQNLAFLYHSSDGGETWHTSDFLIRQGVNKHVHVVKYSAHLQSIVLTDGDNKKQVWQNTTLSHFNCEATKQKAGWQLINKHHHQTGGYLSMAETDEAVLFGSDYLGGTNFIVKTLDGKRFDKLVLPDPYRRSPIMNMITRKAKAGNEIWATSYSCLSGEAKSLLMCTNDSGKSWVRVIEFDGAKHEVRLASTTQKASGTLYISITNFDLQGDRHQHRVYKLTNSKPYPTTDSRSGQ